MSISGGVQAVGTMAARLQDGITLAPQQAVPYVPALLGAADKYLISSLQHPSAVWTPLPSIYRRGRAVWPAQEEVCAVVRSLRV